MDLHKFSRSRLGDVHGDLEEPEESDVDGVVQRVAGIEVGEGIVRDFTAQEEQEVIPHLIHIALYCLTLRLLVCFRDKGVVTIFRSNISRIGEITDKVWVLDK